MIWKLKMSKIWTSTICLVSLTHFPIFNWMVKSVFYGKFRGGAMWYTKPSYANAPIPNQPISIYIHDVFELYSSVTSSWSTLEGVQSFYVMRIIAYLCLGDSLHLLWCQQHWKGVKNVECRWRHNQKILSSFSNQYGVHQRKLIYMVINNSVVYTCTVWWSNII